MLGLKQSELETLREGLSAKTKLCDELRIRSEILAVWSGEGKTLARIRGLQLKCFLALKQYRQWKKHSQAVLANKAKKFKQEHSRRVFQAWHKEFKVYKIQKDKEDFEKALKHEVQSISGTYSKEIDMLRRKLEESNEFVREAQANKTYM